MTVELDVKLFAMMNRLPSQCFRAECHSPIGVLTHCI